MKHLHCAEYVCEMPQASRHERWVIAQGNGRPGRRSGDGGRTVAVSFTTMIRGDHRRIVGG
jgi:hypothetical protein